MSTPRKCTCGATYDRFRSGLTFASVKALMYTGSDDPSTWRRKGRKQVLGYWRELKLQAWEEIHRHCPETWDVAPSSSPDNVIPFKTQAGAIAFARTRARREGRPVKVDVRAGDSVIETWTGDWRGRIRRAA